jgi:cyclopropane-fatty-acyl-phospholipid synthase
MHRGDAEHSGATAEQQDSTRGSAAARAQSAQLLEILFGPLERRSFAVRYWDGAVEAGRADAEPRFTLVLQHPGALRRMLLPPSELGLGEAYLRDDFDVEGDIEAAVEVFTDLVRRHQAPIERAALIAQLLSLPREASADGADTAWIKVRIGGSRHSRERDATAVQSHYDVGNAFYRLWLDRNMVYSCGYFPTGTEDLDTAQLAKFEHICRKLHLQPGEYLLDIGCGWGGLVIYAAQHYGVQALGITLSPAQAAFANERITAAGLAGRVRVELRDYRDLPADAMFDKAVSVGMVEHVGVAQLPTYFSAVYAHLLPGGLFLNHGIALVVPLGRGLSGWINRTLRREGEFMQRYVFPDSELVLPGRMVATAEEAGWETRDLENLREHYAITLRHWVRRLDAQHNAARELVGEQRYRAWRLYMAASAHAFAAGRISVTQILLAKPDAQGSAHLPLSRADLYRDAPAQHGTVSA